jgi:CRISPR-associated protein Cas2
MKLPITRSGAERPNELWYLVFYDIREPKRWREVYKILKGIGERIQYSVFRCRLGVTAREKLHWRLQQALAEEDSILFIGLCGGCVQRIEALNPKSEWPEEPPAFEIL